MRIAGAQAPTHWVKGTAFGANAAGSERVLENTDDHPATAAARPNTQLLRTGGRYR